MDKGYVVGTGGNGGTEGRGHLPRVTEEVSGRAGDWYQISRTARLFDWA